MRDSEVLSTTKTSSSSPIAAASEPQLPHLCHFVRYWRGCKVDLMESARVVAARAMKGVRRADDVVEYEEVRVIGLSVIGALNEILTPEHQSEIRGYVFNHQLFTLGWGMHIEGSSIMFASALNYVTLRLLGEDIDGGEGAIEKARTWILDGGGATYIPSWGKLWLSMLGVYEWSGLKPIPPEIWLFPYFVPFHPGCHE
ncbi:Cycloartenol synthase [Glycine soja]|uniref:Cycloartenol synthase n=1 Tax=Glycine soja TaxID=3848 RepID=A0A445GX31_GLYSO|nr:Cycloartenol synthase [Glycine soja]